MLLCSSSSNYRLIHTIKTLHAINVYTGVVKYLVLPFLTLVLDEGDCSASQPGSFTPE